MLLKWKRCSSTEIILLSLWAWSWPTLPGYGFRDAGFGNRIMLAQPQESVWLKLTELTVWMTPVIAIAKIQSPLERMPDLNSTVKRCFFFSGVICETGSHSVLSIARNLLCHTGCWPTGAVPVSAAWELGSQAFSAVASSWEFSFPFCDRVLFYIPGTSSIVTHFSG